MKQFRFEDGTTADKIRRYGVWFLEAHEKQGVAPPTLGDFEGYLRKQCPDLEVRSDILGRNFNQMSEIAITFDRRMIWRDRHRQVAWEARVGKRPKKKKK